MGGLSGAELSIIVRARDQASRALGRIKGAASGIGSALRTASVVGVAAGAAIGVAAFRAASDFEDAYATIRRGTGATGDALEGLKDDFKAVMSDVPDDMGTVATATADLNTRLGLTGTELQGATRQFLDFARVTETDVGSAIAAGTRAFGDWSIAAKDQAAALDDVYKISQSTGIGADQLLQKVVAYGAPMRQFGFSWQEATTLLGKWEKEGVNTEAILGALKIGVGNFAKEGVDMRTGLQDLIAELEVLGPGADATRRAIEVFGSRAGPDMAAAIIEGRFSLDELMATIDASGETIQTAAADTLTLGDRFGILKNKALVAAEPILMKAMEKLTEVLEDLMPWVEENLPRGIDAVKRGFETAKPYITAFIDAFKLGLDTLRPVVEWVFNFVRDNKPVMIAAIAAIGVAMVVAFGPGAVAIAAVVGLIALIGYVRDNWDELKAKTIEVLESIGSFIDEKLGFIDEVVIRVIGGIIQFWRENWETAWSIVQGVFNLIKVNIQDALTFVRDLFRLVFAIFQGDWSGAWDILKGIVTDRLDFMKQRIEIILGVIRDVFTIGWAVIKDKVLGAMEGIANVVLYILGGIVNFWRDLPGNILDALGDLGSVLFNAGKDLIKGFIDGIKSLPIPNPLDLVPGGGIVKGIGGKIGGALGFQHGGIVTRPTLGLVGEAGPEAIIPLDRLRYLIRSLADRMMRFQQRRVAEMGYFGDLPGLQRFYTGGMADMQTQAALMRRQFGQARRMEEWEERWAGAGERIQQHVHVHQMVVNGNSREVMREIGRLVR